MISEGGIPGNVIDRPLKGQLHATADLTQNGALAGPNTAYGIRMHGNLITL